jgi:5-methyltetrahydrofolate--homocysteine methyltransferase
MKDYAELNQCLYEGKAQEVDRLVREALAAGEPVDEVLNDGLIAGMAVIGEDFKRNILYVPEVLIAARAMKAGMAVLKPLLTADAAKYPPRGTVVMGTVKGDLHDIGKNLVCMMAEGAGFRVVDIGVDQPAPRFIEACREHKAQIVGMSALLTTTMPYMKVVIESFRAVADLADVKLAVGGAPVSGFFSEEIGADGYGADASSSIELFLRFISAGAAAPEPAGAA